MRLIKIIFVAMVFVFLGSEPTQAIITADSNIFDLSGVPQNPTAPSSLGHRNRVCLNTLNTWSESKVRDTSFQLAKGFVRKQSKSEDESQASDDKRLRGKSTKGSPDPDDIPGVEVNAEGMDKRHEGEEVAPPPGLQPPPRTEDVAGAERTGPLHQDESMVPGKR